jgi:peptidoglycan/xylan/chitin deacetylase (PgdA/CDA1 family)
MLKVIKKCVLYGAKFSGFTSLVRESNWRKQRLLILAYHGVSIEDEHHWDPALFVPPEFLRERFNLILKNGCVVLPLEEAIQRLYNGSLPKKAVAITFDDGYFNFYDKALPIIKEFDFPVTVYLTTYYSNFNKPVFGIACDYIIWKAKDGSVVDLQKLIGRDEKIELGDKESHQKAFALLLSYAENKLSAIEKDELLKNLAESLGVDFDEICSKRIMNLMNLNEVESCVKAGVDIQLHTHRHRTPLEEKLFLNEISDNRQAIQSVVNRPINHFCYPSGIYNKAFFPWLKSANIVSATTCDVALSTKQTNPFLLPRFVDTMSLSTIEFEGWLAGVSQFLPQRKNGTR